MNTPLDRLLKDPSSWVFRPTEEEIARVRDAFVGFQISNGFSPDVDSLRVCIMGGFDGDVDAMVRFWDGTLVDDMPDLGDVDEGMREQVSILWRQRKLSAIVASLDLPPVVEWERRSTSACLKSPDQLRDSATDLDLAVEEGFSLLSWEIEEESAVVTWYLRRKKEET